MESILLKKLKQMSKNGLPCAVCFGDPVSPMVQGLNNGIFLMLGVLCVILLGFAALFLAIRQRSKKFKQVSVS